MMAGLGLTLRCPKCGFEATASTDALKREGEALAASVSDAELARRYRKAASFYVRSALPESMWRLPLARIAAMSDADAVELGRRVANVLFDTQGGA